MAFKHGIYPNEIPTALVPPSCLADGVPVFIGTAPIQQVEGGLNNVNKAIFCSNYADAVAQLGYSEKWEKYTLCEAIYGAFALYGIGPVIFINVLDPAEHMRKVSDVETSFAEGKADLPDGVIVRTLKVKSADGAADYEANADYVTSYADDGTLRLIVIEGGRLDGAASVKIDADILDPERVTKADIIGGIDINDGKRKGAEVISEVFLRFTKIPGSIGAPGWSGDSEVGAILTAKGYGINGIFKAQMVALDISAETCKKYSDVPAAKKSLNFVDPLQTVVWPLARLGDKVFHGSTAAILRKALTDYESDGVPFKSPSNKAAKMDAAVLADGTEVWLDLTDANYINENGVCTFLNFFTGWVFWGNRTACYPGVTDPKDTFICVRSMMSWWGNREVTTYWQKVDAPMNKRLLTTILNSMKVDINGLKASGALLGGECVIYSDENPTTELIDGKIAFHVKLGFVTPAEEIKFNNEYDTSYIAALVARLAS